MTALIAVPAIGSTGCCNCFDGSAGAGGPACKPLAALGCGQSDAQSSCGALIEREYGVEKLLRDAKLTPIYEGTNQINRFEIMHAVSGERA